MTDPNDFAILKFNKAFMPPGTSLVACYEVNGVPQIADERYAEDYVVVRREDLLKEVGLIELLFLGLDTDYHKRLIAALEPKP